VKLEAAGIPTATVVTDEFLDLAKVEAQTRGLHELPLIRVPHPVGSISFESLKPLAERTVDGIVEALVCGRDRIEDSVRAVGTSGLEPPSVAKVPAEPGRMFQYLSEKGWTDGLPVIAPTPETVREMINACRFDKDEILGIIPPLNGVATIEKVAANAVMAGCLPAYFSVVIAAMKGILQPGFNLDGVQTTTGNVAPLIIVNGPCRQALEINCSSNVLGQGWRANATIGRAIRLVLTNIGGATPRGLR
jgi:hypothetical protein